MLADIKVRRSARVVLLDDDDRLLLLRVHDPAAPLGPNPLPVDFWLLPGGGLQPGETFAQAAYREVGEETGLRDVVIGRCVWTQEKVVRGPSGKTVLAISRYFVGRVSSAGAVVSFAGHEALEAATIVGFRWFTHAEVLAREGEETFVPAGLGALLGGVLSGIPDHPVSITVR